MRTIDETPAVTVGYSPVIDHWHTIVRRADEALASAAGDGYTPFDWARLARTEFYDAAYDVCGYDADYDRRLLDACACHYALRVRHTMRAGS